MIKLLAVSLILTFSFSANASDFYNGKILKIEDLYDAPVYKEEFEKTILCGASDDFEGCMLNNNYKHIDNIDAKKVIYNKNKIKQTCQNKFEERYCSCFVNTLFNRDTSSLEERIQTHQKRAYISGFLRVYCLLKED